MPPVIRAVDPTIEAKVAFLRRPSSYLDRPTRIEAIETHMSWVFLTAAFAYKLKKPIRLGTLDYRRLESRLLNCRREVDLNRRLAPDVYLGVVALRLDEDGRMHLDDSGRCGRPVEWLVKMRRLPEEATLHHAIVSGNVDTAAMARVAARLMAFFDAAAVVAVAPDVYCARFAALIDETHAALNRPAFGLRRARLDRLAAAQHAFLAANADALAARASHVIEGHGDLRPEHVYLYDTPIMTDCLEFDRELRLLDPLDELAFLAMECERLGAPHMREHLIDPYRAASGDGFTPALVDFYASCNACVRARLAAWHIDDPGMRDAGKWRRRARQYLAIAQIHARSMLVTAPGRRGNAARGHARRERRS